MSKPFYLTYAGAIHALKSLIWNTQSGISCMAHSAILQKPCVVKTSQNSKDTGYLRTTLALKKYGSMSAVSRNTALKSDIFGVNQTFLDPFSQDCGLASHFTNVVCINFIHEWRDLYFNVDSERQIYLRNTFKAFLFTLRVFARNLLRGSRRRNISFMFYF